MSADTPKPSPETTGPAEEPASADRPQSQGASKKKEIGGPAGPEPTRYGDWEVNGRCSDF